MIKLSKGQNSEWALNLITVKQKQIYFLSIGYQIKFRLNGHTP